MKLIERIMLGEGGETLEGTLAKISIRYAVHSPLNYIAIYTSMVAINNINQASEINIVLRTQQAAL